MTEENLPANQASFEKLERQLEHSGLYNHTVLSQFAERINENEAFLYGLIDFLIEKNGFTPEDLKPYIDKVKREAVEAGESLHAGVALRIIEDEQSIPTIAVNCGERMHICKGVCCKLNFALTPEEVESRDLKWELGHPYFIRHEKSGYCSHMDEQKNCCNVYDKRPAVCRNYSCREDARIWTDFENMELNTEWINEHLQESRPRIFSINMSAE
jgi:Fe-S-cluster containining protein